MVHGGPDVEPRRAGDTCPEVQLLASPMDMRSCRLTSRGFWGFGKRFTEAASESGEGRCRMMCRWGALAFINIVLDPDKSGHFMVLPMVVMRPGRTGFT